MNSQALASTFRPVSHWFAGQSFWMLVMVYTLLSYADLSATLQTVPTGFMREANGMANSMLQHFGAAGMIFQKAALVALVVITLHYVAARQPRLAVNVLWGAVLIMAFVALYHVTLIAGLIMG